MRYLVAFSCLLFGSAQAATVYSYTGNNFEADLIDNHHVIPGTYTSDMFVSASFTVDSEFGEMGLTNITEHITEFSFFDGRNTLTQDNSEIIASIAVDSSGEIIQWQMEARTPSLEELGAIEYLVVTYYNPGTDEVIDWGVISECTSIPPFQIGNPLCLHSRDWARNLSDQGTWAVSAAVPVPGAVWLLGSGLVFLAGVRRRSIKSE